MFDNLLESKRVRQKSVSSTITSVTLHILLVTGAVYATAKVQEETDTIKQQDVEYVELKKDEPPPPEEQPREQPPPDMPNTPPPPKGFQTLTAPIEIPTVIPEIDLTRSVTNELDFSGKGVQGGIASGVVGGTGKVEDDQPYFSFEVDKPASAIPGNTAPSYPTVLKNNRFEGRVIARFVVDTTGRADMSTFKVIESDHQLFTNAVQSVLPRHRFIPAEVGSRKVPVWVEQAFEFKVSGN